MKRIISVLCAVVILFSFVACTNKNNKPNPVTSNSASEPAIQTASKPSPTIACIYAEITGEFWGIAANGANAALEELKASGRISGDSYLIAPSIDRNAAQQKDLIDEAIQKRVDGIILSPAHADEIGIYISDNMKNLADGGIPIIVIDRTLYIPELFDCIVTTMTTDIASMSEECGKLAAEALGGAGEYVYIEIDPSSSGLRDRNRQAIEWLDKNAPDMKRMGIADDGIFWASPAGGIEAIKPFIQKELLTNIDKNKDIVILCATEAYTIEVCNAIRESNIQRTGKTMVIGFDFYQPIYDLIKNGEVYGACGQNAYLLGYDSLYLLLEYLDGKRIKEYTYCAYTTIKQTNLETDEVQAYLKIMGITL